MPDSMLDKPAREGWTVDTALAYVLSVIKANDGRYEERFAASQKALELGFSGQKDAINAAFAAQKDAVQSALASADRAVQKAELASDKRFESVNEFRATLADQQRNLIPRSEVQVIVTSMMDKLGALEKQIDQMQAERLGIKGGWGYAVGVVGFVLTVMTLIGVAFNALTRP